MGWGAAIAAVGEAVNKIFTWKTGGRSKSENVLRDEAEHWKDAYDKAMASGDYVSANVAMRELRRVRDKARSQFTGP